MSIRPGSRALGGTLAPPGHKPRATRSQAPPPGSPRRLRQLKASRKALRDYNTAARVQLEAQGPALEAAAGLLAGMRADLDAVNGALRCACSAGACMRAMVNAPQSRPLYAHPQLLLAGHAG